MAKKPNNPGGPEPSIAEMTYIGEVGGAPYIETEKNPNNKVIEHRKVTRS